MSAPALLIGLPAYGGQVSVTFMESMLRFAETARQQGISIIMRVISQESLIPRGRNALVAEFLGRKELTHLLFIDADMGFEPRAILRMLAFGKPVTGVASPKKHIDWARVQAAAQGGMPTEKLAQAGLSFALSIGSEDSLPDGPIPVTSGFVKVARCGTGVMLIERAVFERLAEKYPGLRYENDIPGYDSAITRGNFWGFFDTLHHPVSRKYLSEDFAFCHRWTEGCSGEIWMDVESPITHVGSYAYTGSFLQVVPLTPA